MRVVAVAIVVCTVVGVAGYLGANGAPKGHDAVAQAVAYGRDTTVEHVTIFVGRAAPPQTERSLYVGVPSTVGSDLSGALLRLRAVGLRATFPATHTACGNGLPFVSIQRPRSHARVKRGTVVTLSFANSPIPSPAVPLHHALWTYVPAMIGEAFSVASGKLNAIWPCVNVQPATSTSASRVIVVAQSPDAGTRVRAFGVLSNRGYRPTTVTITVAARP